MPQVTSIGTSYKFDTIDLSTIIYQSNYFDEWFPFLKDEKTNLTKVQVSTWFTSYTGGIIYGMNMSDWTQAPQWLEFSRDTGQLVLDPQVSDLSELLNIRFSIRDSN